MKNIIVKSNLQKKKRTFQTLIFYSIEVFWGITFAIIIYLFDKTTIFYSLIVTILATFFGLQRFLIARMLNVQKEEIISSNCIECNDEVKLIAKHYSKIEEQIFIYFKERLLKETILNLKEMSDKKCSPKLSSYDFYRTIFNLFDKIDRKIDIWAVSKMNKGEWLDNDAENEFMKKNEIAILKGINICWLFVLDQLSHDITRNKFINKLLNLSKKHKNLLLLTIEKGQIKRANLYFDYLTFNEGFIAFGNKEIVWDEKEETKEEVGLNGYLSINTNEIEKVKYSFNKIKEFSSPLT